MSFSRFFIDRPVFAGALSTLILLAGIVSLFRLPVSEYPDVVPPLIVVNAEYPAAPLEEQINGVEDMLYMQSQANSDGNLTLSVTFKVGTDPDKAQQLVQNRVSQALPRLPEDVRRLGVVTMKSSSTQTLAVHLVSPDDQYNATYLRNYGILNIKNQLERIPGVGEVRIWGGGDYAMRIWLDPDRRRSDRWSAHAHQRGSAAVGQHSGPIEIRAGVRRHHPQELGRWRRDLLACPITGCARWWMASLRWASASFRWQVATRWRSPIRRGQSCSRPGRTCPAGSITRLSSTRPGSCDRALSR